MVWKEKSKAVVVLILFSLIGCTTTPNYNQPLKSYDANSGYRYQNIDAGENSDSLLVILTFSGGGTRASALSLGVLEKLSSVNIEWEGRQCRLLDEVDVISSVSGGSFTAAYFGLFGDRVFDEYPATLYKKNQKMLIRNAFNLSNIVKQASPLYSRTDTTAIRYDESLYEGKTYSDLLAVNRPYIILNATDMGMGRQFSFTQENFDLIYSDLSSYPVGYAVAASSAFPGAFSAMVLKNHEQGDEFIIDPKYAQALSNKESGSTKYRTPEYLNSYLDPEKKYLHLSDGGVSDNLGLLPVIQSLAFPDMPGSFTPIISGKKEQKVVIITVNAAKDTGDQISQKNKPPGVFKLLNTAGTTPLDWFSKAQLAYMELLANFIENSHDSPTSKLIYKATNEARIEAGESPRKFYFIVVGFDKLKNPEQRGYFETIPTKFTLDETSITRLREIGGQILEDDATFQKLLEEISVN